jgi:hypothetical protein
VFPKNNIINKDTIKDIKYANENKHTNLNVEDFIKSSNKVFNKYKTLCKKSTQFPVPNININNKLTTNQINYLKKIYIGPSDDFIQNCIKLISLYEIMGINNMQLSIPPIYDGVELFGSVFNSHNKYFCSAFELEKFFGSLGSFWKYAFHKNGIYLCNPPFDEMVIDKMAIKLLQNLKSTKCKVTIIITIPVWDSASQRELGIKDYNLQFKAYNKLITNNFYKESLILDKYEFKYYDYYTEKMISAAYTHLIILSNITKYIFNINEFIKKWKDFSK